MENKKPHGFCVTPDSKCTMNYCDDNGCVDRKRIAFEEGEWTASGSVAAPTWYTENEMYDWLTRNNYHENIAKELSSKWAADLQGAFNKGFEKGTRELKEREEALKELLPLAQNFASTLRWDEEYSGDEVGGKEAQAIIERARKLLSK